MKNLVIGLILIAVLGLVLYFAPQRTTAPTTNDNNSTAIVDYDSCVEAGNPITNGNPLTCTADGKDYVDNTSVVTEPEVVIDTPQIAQIVTSPMIIKGKAMNNWFFEANLPIELRDENGKVLAQKGYMTTEDWMTPGYKTIDTTLSFKAPATDYGVLIIHNDNPSGLPENDKKLEVPVRFR